MGKNTNRNKINHCTLTFSLFDLYTIRKYISVCMYACVCAGNTSKKNIFRPTWPLST